MPTTKRPEPNDEEDVTLPPTRGATIQDRIAAFEMLDAMMDKTQAEKMMRLRLVGFSNSEISGMLQVSPAGVSQGLYEQRQKAAGKKHRPRKPRAPSAG
jgi:DNA-directed RNA polymerase specialized sigma24 family protein